MGGNLKRRLMKLEAYQRGLFSVWLKQASDEELKARLRELLAKAMNCKPEEIDTSPEALDVLCSHLRTALSGAAHAKF